ncbi:hypothetical protein CRG98_029701 [Punica granatum]|uniref:Uncharacterized protein n=1 Tax=Punica granatum TaxID=22663 RepID=A0A2I0J104_PUNGR|nr:hypothetical protein CRG98_029701 [Punica granatum]
MNHTTHLDLSRNTLRVSDALFMSLGAQSQQTEITMISGSPKQLRKQSEKSNFDLLGHLRLDICITGIRVKGPCDLTVYVKMTDMGCRCKICCQKWVVSIISVKNNVSGEQCTCHPSVCQSSARNRARARARTRVAPITVRESLRPHVLPLACMHVCARHRASERPSPRDRAPTCASAHQTSSRAPSRAFHSFPRPLSSIQGLHRVNRLSNTSSTLSSYPEARYNIFDLE